MSRTLLFDLDGTLIDSIELIHRSKDHAFQSCGRAAPSDQEWLAGVGTPLQAMFAHYAANDAEIAAFIRSYREYQLTHHDRLVRPYEGAHETLTALRARGYPIGIVTSKSVELSKRGLQHVGLSDLIDTIVGCDSCTKHKPDPEPVFLALDQLASPPERALFIGDSVHDMQAGNAAGVITVAALWGPFDRAALASSAPRFFLDRIADLPALLEQLDGETTRMGAA